MKILDLLKDVSIDVNATCSNKDEAIDTLVSLMAKQGNLNDQDVYKQGIYAREELSTTGIGEGIAILVYAIKERKILDSEEEGEL